MESYTVSYCVAHTYTHSRTADMKVHEGMALHGMVPSTNSPSVPEVQCSVCMPASSTTEPVEKTLLPTTSHIAASIVYIKSVFGVSVSESPSYIHRLHAAQRALASQCSAFT